MPDASTYDPATPAGQVRLLLNDTSAPFVFTDPEVSAFLTLEGGTPLLAAALAIETNGSNEALASKVWTDSDGKSTDGAAVAKALQAHAAGLRARAVAQAAADGDGSFDLVGGSGSHPELTEWWVR